MNFSTKCLCGKVSVSLALSTSIENYAPRQCDCNFCQQHQLAYLSDASGHLSITSITLLKKLQQGSAQAIFWQCSGCEQIIAVTHLSGEELRGAVNAQLFSSNYNFPPAIVVSPKLLSPKEKRQRWSTMWLKVSFIDVAPA